MSEVKILQLLLTIFAVSYNANSCFNETKVLRYVWLISVVLFFSIINAFSLYLRDIILYRNIKIISVIYTDLFNGVYDYVQHIVNIYFVFQFENDMEIYLRNQERLEKLLGEQIFAKLNLTIIKYIIYFLIIFIAAAVAKHLTLDMIYGSDLVIVYAITYFNLLMKIVTNLDFVRHVINIEYMLRSVANVMESNYESIVTHNIIDDIVSNKQGLQITAIKVKTKRNPRYFKDIQLCMKFYYILVEQSVFLNKLFGVRNLVSNVGILFHMVITTYVMTSFMLAPPVTVRPYNKYIIMAAGSMDDLVYVSILFTSVYHCEQAYKQTNRVIKIVNGFFVNTQIDLKWRAALAELQSQLQSQPVEFSMCGFSRVDYKLMIATVSTVVTYTIILLQNV